jgi:plastocyanin
MSRPTSREPIVLDRRKLLHRAAAALTLVAAGSVRAGAVEVQIKGNLFIPETLTVKAGSTVKWINTERRTSHSVLFPQEGNLESERMLPGESWERRFDKPGRYPYTCSPHPEMKGLVVVE